MIEIKAKLLRNQSAVFLCGETVEVFVTFCNHSLPEHKISQSNADVMENLAWASVQINGYCKTQEFKVPQQNVPLEIPKTSLNVHENSFLATDPKILFCDLRLANGESRTYYYREQVPSCAPTYRGVDIKYYYKVSISTQRVGSRVQLLQVPIRVLPLLIEDKPEQQPAPCDVTNDELTPTNPFLENDRKVVSKVEIALENLQNITARRRPNFYVITNRRGKVGRFCLFKPCYKLGEDIIGTLDFSCRTIRCVQLSVTLQCEEILAGKVPSKPSTENKDLSKDATGKITNFTKHHEICIGLLQTQMILPIPLHVTPSFTTEKVDVRWRLHFQFVTTTSTELMPTDAPVGETWQGPTKIDIETMVWNLPITVYSTNPTQIFYPSAGEALTLR